MGGFNSKKASPVVNCSDKINKLGTVILDNLNKVDGKNGNDIVFAKEEETLAIDEAKKRIWDNYNLGSIHCSLAGIAKKDQNREVYSDTADEYIEEVCNDLPPNEVCKNYSGSSEPNMRDKIAIILFIVVVITLVVIIYYTVDFNVMVNKIPSDVAKLVKNKWMEFK